MPAIGPSPSAHLAKRKRSTSTSDANSPRHKLSSTGPTPPFVLGNPDELALNDSSEDEYGPSIPSKNKASSASKSASPKRVLGPSAPSQNPDQISMDDSSEDDYGPSIPKSATAPIQVPAPPPTRRVLGPAPPPAPLSERPLHPADSSSDDDDYGPSLPPAPGTIASTQLQARLAASAATSSQSQEPPKPQRAEWMLVPPSGPDNSRVDPTKLKSRKFASGKGAKAPAEKTGVSAIWTETPEEKRKRLEDEVLGRKDTAASSAPKSGELSGMSKAEARKAEETERRVREYNDKNRNRSLMDEINAQGSEGGTQKEKDDDPSKRGFDREKDMAIGGRMGHMQRKEMLAKAADFESRFQKGKYL